MSFSSDGRPDPMHQDPGHDPTQHQPGPEPADPWADDEVRRADEQGWTSEPGGMGPIPSRTWSRGNSRVVVGGCCLPLPLGCLTTVVAAGVALAVARRR